MFRCSFGRGGSSPPQREMQKYDRRLEEKESTTNSGANDDRLILYFLSNFYSYFKK